MRLWEDVWLAENAEVLPRSRRQETRGLWLVYGLLAGNLIVGVNVALQLL